MSIFGVKITYEVLKMKKANLVLASLLSLVVLASCETESTSTSSESVDESSAFSTSIEDDPYAAVLSGLDTTLGTAYETYTDSSDEEIGGAYGYVSGNIAYGWVEYTSYGASYGVAVAVTFNDANEATGIEIGAPADGSHNYTPYYAMSYEAGYAEYQVYLANVESAVTNATVGEDAGEIYSAFAGTELDPTTSTFTPGVSLVGAGATQTDARLGIAIKYAAESWILNLEDPASTDYSSELGVTSADALEAATTVAASTTDANGNTVLYGAVHYTSWGAYYGAAVEITVANNVITSVEWGVPYAEAHNFTPMYKTSAPLSYWNYVNNWNSVYSYRLVGQILNSDLLAVWTGYGIGTDDSGSTTYTSPALVTVDAGATQSYARGSMAVLAALDYVL